MNNIAVRPGNRMADTANRWLPRSHFPRKDSSWGAALLALVALNASAASWEPIGVLDPPSVDGRIHYTTFVDKTTLRKEKGLRRITLLTNYSPDSEVSLRKEMDGLAVDARYRSVKSTVYVDCKARKFGESFAEFYSEEMGSGELVYASERPSKGAILRWKNVDVGGFFRSRIDAICKL